MCIMAFALLVAGFVAVATQSWQLKLVFFCRQNYTGMVRREKDARRRSSSSNPRRPPRGFPQTWFPATIIVRRPDHMYRIDKI